MIKALIKGLALTLRHFFSKPITLRYPEEKRQLPAAFRGRPVLLAKDDGMPVCVACGLCERICPGVCITVTPAEGPQGERLVKDYVLDLSRCCFCGFCELSCPVGAIRMGSEYELAVNAREELVYPLDRLLQRGRSSVPDMDGSAAGRTSLKGTG